jgi:hypothetical protein
MLETEVVNNELPLLVLLHVFMHLNLRFNNLDAENRAFKCLQYKRVHNPK